MSYFTKHAKPATRKNKWEKIIDFTKIDKGGVSIKEILAKL